MLLSIIAWGKHHQCLFISIVFNRSSSVSSYRFGFSDLCFEFTFQFLQRSNSELCYDQIFAKTCKNQKKWAEIFFFKCWGLEPIPAGERARWQLLSKILNRTRKKRFLSQTQICLQERDFFRQERFQNLQKVNLFLVYQWQLWLSRSSVGSLHTDQTTWTAAAYSRNIGYRANVRSFVCRDMYLLPSHSSPLGV